MSWNICFSTLFCIFSMAHIFMTESSRGLFWFVCIIRILDVSGILCDLPREQEHAFHNVVACSCVRGLVKHNLLCLEASLFFGETQMCQIIECAHLPCKRTRYVKTV